MKKKILLVEDERALCLLYEEELSRGGIRRHRGDRRRGRPGPAGRGRRSTSIITDIRMPGKNGIELIAQIMGLRKDIPIIINSAYQSYKEDFMTWAADAYVVKSSSLDELKAKIGQLLGDMMSELRKDLVSGRWVIIATERSKRPDDFRPQGVGRHRSPRPPGSARSARGNEGKTPPEVFALRAAGTAPGLAGLDGPCRAQQVPGPQSRAAAAQGRRGRLPVGWRDAASTKSSSRIPTTPSSSRTCRSRTSGTSSGSSSKRIQGDREDLHYQYVQIFKNKGK
ncbi:MAG: response regulator [Desulfobacterales bacterium]|nr:response regulator [Desulfobacterales bacterium]